MLKLLLVGAGAVVSEHYCSPLRRLEKAGIIRVLAVVDPNETRAKLTATHFRNAEVFSDLDAAFGHKSFDLAIIATPPGLHIEHVSLAITNNCHVLCEKPMATNLAEVERMNAAAAKADRILGVAFSRRFYSNYADVVNIVKNGELGDNLRFVFREGDTFRWPITTGAVFDREHSGGGVLLDKGVHMIDQLCWIFGEGALERSFDDSLNDGVETNSLLELVFPNARGEMQVSWEFSLNSKLHIFGSFGEILLDGADNRSFNRKSKSGWVRVPASTTWPADMKEFGGKRTLPGNVYASFDLQLIAMLRCIVYGEEFPVTGSGAARVQAIIDMAYARAEPMPKLWLSEDEQKSVRNSHWKEVQSK